MICLCTFVASPALRGPAIDLISATRVSIRRSLPGRADRTVDYLFTPGSSGDDVRSQNDGGLAGPGVAVTIPYGASEEGVRNPGGGSVRVLRSGSPVKTTVSSFLEPQPLNPSLAGE
jgi:hypothetical protein